jgi:hypothetical protein
MSLPKRANEIQTIEGIAMSATNELSFLPEDYLEKKYMRRAIVLCVVLLILAGCGTFYWWKITSKRHARVQAEFDEVNNSYVDAARKIEQVKRMHEQQREVVHHAELAASLVERVPRSNMLAEITNALPVGVSLFDFSMAAAAHNDSAPSTSFAMHKAAIEAKQQNSDALGLGTKPPQFDITVKMTGIAHDDIQVAQLISRLSHDKMFADVNLIVTDNYTVQRGDGATKGETVRRWQLEMMINPLAEVRDDLKTAAVEVTK